MPPLAEYDKYSSVLDGSLRVESSTSNSERYGKGSLIVENGCDFYGDSDQYLKTTNTAANFYIQSAKSLNASAPQGAVFVSGYTGASLSASAGNVTVSGTSANLTAGTGYVLVSGGSSAGLISTLGSVSITGATSASISSTSGPASLTADSGNVTVEATVGTVTLKGTSKSELFGSANVSSTNNYTITSTSGTASLNSTDSEASVNGKTLALLSGTDAVTVKSASGNALVEATVGTVELKGITKLETFTGTSTSNITSDYSVVSSAGNATLQSTTKDVLVSGKTLAHILGEKVVKVQSSVGNIQLLGATGVYSQAPDITLSAGTIANVNAPAINIVSTNISTLDGPTVEVGKTSTDVKISHTGYLTTVEGNLTINGTTNTKAINTTGDCTINGNLTVTGTTTTINTEKLVVEDNIIVLNSASAIGKDAGLLFTRSGATGPIDSAAMFWDESATSFVLASTKDGPDSITLNKEAYSTLTCGDIISKSVSMPNFGTKTFTLQGDNHEYVFITEINKLRGSYEFQIQSADNDGSVYNYKMVKAKADMESSSFGVHANGEDGSQVWVKWSPNEAPKFYMKNTGTAGDKIFYVNYLTVV
jgi:hypothetical protein